jgi:hypothetical protein
MTARKRRSMPKPGDKPPPSGPVTVITVNPAAWDKALELADGNVHRIRHVDENTLLVCNWDLRDERG